MMVLTIIPFFSFLLVISGKSYASSVVFRENTRVTRQVLDATNASIANAVIEVFNNCQCVEYYLCDEDNYIITDGRTIIEQRFQETLARKVCEGGSYRGEMVCCRSRSTDSTNSTLREPTLGYKNEFDKNLNNNGTNPNNDHESNNRTHNKPPKKKKKFLCGTQLPTINVRIFAGKDELTSINGEFPWLAAIFKKEDDNYKFHCSGSLIHPKVVLTANHCVKRFAAEDIAVSITGDVELPNMDRSEQISTTKKVSEFIRHPDFNSGTLYNDIALVILTEPFEINRSVHNINTICLPSKRKNLDNLKCLVAGWGKTQTNEGNAVLKKVQLPTLSNTRCEHLLRTNTRLGPYFELHESFLCAGGEEGKDACKGDGGSPLMCPMDSGRYFQAGIVSWGIGCGTKDVPGVYTKVSHFHDWIKTELDQRQLSIE